MKTSEHRKKIILLEQSSKEDLLIGQLPENQLVFDLLKHTSIFFFFFLKDKYLNERSHFSIYNGAPVSKW